MTYFWILAHSAVQSCCSSAMILRDVSSSLRVHRSSAASGVRYPFTTSLQRNQRKEEVSHTHQRLRNRQFAADRCIMILGGLQKTGDGCEERAYPVNHQKRNFDRKEASLTGHGFCNIANNSLTAGFVANYRMVSVQLLHLLVMECWVICKSALSLGM